MSGTHPRPAAPARAAGLPGRRAHQAAAPLPTALLHGQRAHMRTMDSRKSGALKAAAHRNLRRQNCAPGRGRPAGR